jgi:hypothetical protein
MEMNNLEERLKHVENHWGFLEKTLYDKPTNKDHLSAWRRFKKEIEWYFILFEKEFEEDKAMKQVFELYYRVINHRIKDCTDGNQVSKTEIFQELLNKGHVKYMTDEIQELLKNRGTKLEWLEPWAGCDSDLKDVDSHIRLSATVEDCINLQRRILKNKGRLDLCNDDEGILVDFVAIHWATIVKD